MLRSLVGSEMCIRDRTGTPSRQPRLAVSFTTPDVDPTPARQLTTACLHQTATLQPPEHMPSQNHFCRLSRDCTPRQLAIRLTKLETNNSSLCSTTNTTCNSHTDCKKNDSVDPATALYIPLSQRRPTVSPIHARKICQVHYLGHRYSKTRHLARRIVCLCNNNATSYHTRLRCDADSS